MSAKTVTRDQLARAIAMFPDVDPSPDEDGNIDRSHEWWATGREFADAVLSNLTSMDEQPADPEADLLARTRATPNPAVVAPTPEPVAEQTETPVEGRATADPGPVGNWDTCDSQPFEGEPGFVLEHPRPDCPPGCWEAVGHVHEFEWNMHAGMEEWVCACGEDKHELAVEDVLAAAVALYKAWDAGTYPSTTVELMDLETAVAAYLRASTPEPKP